MNNEGDENMAQDRLWIRCKICGKGKLIATLYSTGEFVTHTGMLDAFLSEHLHERENMRWKLNGDLESEPGFEFVTDDAKTSTGQLFCEDGEPLWRNEAWSKQEPETKKNWSKYSWHLYNNPK